MPDRWEHLGKALGASGSERGLGRWGRRGGSGRSRWRRPLGSGFGVADRGIQTSHGAGHRYLPIFP